jgi:hypothetical protein
LQLLLIALKAETALTQGVADGGNVSGATHLDGDVDHGFAEADAIAGAIVSGFDVVYAFTGEDFRQIVQDACFD